MFSNLSKPTPQTNEHKKKEDSVKTELVSPHPLSILTLQIERPVEE
jgi:hypothetical protein